MATERIKIASLDIDIDSVLKSSSQYLREINKLKQAQKELKESGQNSGKVFTENDAKLRNLNKAYRDSQKFAASLLTVNKNLDDVIRSEGKSTQELFDSRRQLNEIAKNITGDTKEEIALRQKLNKAIDDQTEELRTQQSEYNSSKDRVGEYSQAIEGALGRNTLFGKTFGIIREGLQTVRPLYNAFVSEIREGISQMVNFRKVSEGIAAGQKVAAQATNLTSGALRIFRAALIATGIGAIIVVLGSLISFLSGTQKGIDSVTKVTRPLSFLFARFQGIIQQVGEALFNAFKNPQETIKRLGERIKQNIINRLSAVGKIGKALGKIISSGFTDGFDELQDAVLQGATGVENFADKAKKAFKAIGDEMKGAVKDGLEYDELLKKIEREEIKQIERQSKLSLEAKKANLIAEDTTKSLAEREQGAIKARDIQLKLIEDEKLLNDLRVKAILLKQKQSDTLNTEKKELAELQAANRKFEESRIEAQTTFNNKLNQIRAERQRKIDEAEKEQADNEEKTRLKREEKRSKELEAIRAFEEQKKALENEIELQKESDSQAKEELRLQQQFERQKAEIENLKLTAEQEKELLALLETEKQQTLDEIRDKFQNQALDKFKQTQEKELQIRKANAQETAAIAKQLTGILTKFLGDSLGAQLAGISIKAAVDAGLVKITTASAQAQNLAQATATAPPPFNVPFILQAGVQNAALAAQSTSSISKILAGAALQGFSTVASKFAEGGILRGPSHAYGGIPTPFGEVEGNEIILTKGVTKNPVLRSIASYINVAGGGKRFESGGIFGSNSPLVQSGFSSGGNINNGIPVQIDYEKLGAVLASKINDVKIVTPVDTITDIQATVAIVEKGANL